MLVTSLECSEMVTSDLPRSQDLTLPVLSWLKGLIWGQASTGGGVHECVYKVCIHMSVLSWVVVVFGERGFFHLRSTCFGNTGLEKITQDSLLKDFSEYLLFKYVLNFQKGVTVCGASDSPWNLFLCVHPRLRFCGLGYAKIRRS